MSKKTTTTKYKLTLEYDGTQYSGWQKQNDAKTVQGELLKAACSLFDTTELDIQGCGRTDAGVHASNYVAHLEVTTKLAAPAVLNGLNSLLPKDIVVLRAEKTAPQFHARHSCVGRSYVYQIAKRKLAFGKKYVWWVREPLDLAAMRAAAGELVGMHDFQAFAEKQELKKSTKVLVRLAEVSEEGDLIIFRIVASHFLWKMVRRLVGMLVEVGAHRLRSAEVRDLLSAGAAETGVSLAPPSGLFFEQAFYSDEELAEFLQPQAADEQ